MVNFRNTAQSVIASLAASTDGLSDITFTNTTYTRDAPYEDYTASSTQSVTVKGYFGPMQGVARMDGEMVRTERNVIIVAAKDLGALTLGLNTTAAVNGKTFATDRFEPYGAAGAEALFVVDVSVA